MWKLIPTVAAAMLFSVLTERTSLYRLGENGEKHFREPLNLFFLALVLSLSSLVGLRTSYNDTVAYIHTYENTEIGFDGLAEADWSLGANPGYMLMRVAMKTLGFSTQSYLMAYAVFTIFIYLWFIRKYAESFWYSVFLFITMGCYTFTMAAVKQTVAIAFCLIGTDRAIRGRWISSFFWIIIGALFHPYSLMYLAVPLMVFPPWTSYTYLVLLVFGTFGAGLHILVGRVVDVTSMLGEEFTEEMLMGEGVNAFRLAVVWMPVIVSFMTRKFLKRSKNRAENVIMNLMMLNAEIMFVALFGTANYFARLANYFLIFQAIALPSLFRYFADESRELMFGGSILGYSAFFYYSNAVMYGGFDQIYNGIKLWDYLR